MPRGGWHPRPRSLRTRPSRTNRGARRERSPPPLFPTTIGPAAFGPRSWSPHHRALSRGSASSCTLELRVGSLGDGLDRAECLVGSQRLDGVDRGIQLPEHLIAGLDVDLYERIRLPLGVENPLPKLGVYQCPAEQGIELGFVVHDSTSVAPARSCASRV